MERTAQPTDPAWFRVCTDVGTARAFGGNDPVVARRGQDVIFVAHPVSGPTRWAFFRPQGEDDPVTFAWEDLEPLNEEACALVAELALSATDEELRARRQAAKNVNFGMLYGAGKTAHMVKP
jgi:hypothetical protein